MEVESSTGFYLDTAPRLYRPHCPVLFLHSRLSHMAVCVPMLVKTLFRDSHPIWTDTDGQRLRHAHRHLRS